MLNIYIPHCSKYKMTPSRCAFWCLLFGRPNLVFHKENALI